MPVFTPAQLAAMKFLVARMAADFEGRSFDPSELGWVWLAVPDQVCATVDEVAIQTSDIALSAYELMRTLVDAQAAQSGCPRAAVVADLALTLALCEG